jgi:hypothetical protein
MDTNMKRVKEKKKSGGLRMTSNDCHVKKETFHCYRNHTPQNTKKEKSEDSQWPKTRLSFFSSVRAERDKSRPLTKLPIHRSEDHIKMGNG